MLNPPDRTQPAYPNLPEHHPRLEYAKLEDVDGFFLYSVFLYLQKSRGNIDAQEFSLTFEKIMPTKELGREACHRLYEVGALITRSELSDRYQEERLAMSGYMEDTRWFLAEDATGLSRSEVMLLLDERVKNFEYETITELWFMIAHAECKRYLRDMCKKYNFSSDALISEKVKEAVNYCLMRLSIPQVWNILWCVMRDIAALIQTGTYTRPHVYNMIPNNIVREVDRRLANFKAIKPWNRQPIYLEAVSTTLLFEKVLINYLSPFDSLCGHEMLERYMEKVQRNNA